MGNFFPALSIQQPESPLQQFGQAQAIVGEQQRQQLAQLQIQEHTRLLKDEDAATRALGQWDGKSYDQLPDLVRNAGGSFNAYKQMLNGILEAKQKAADISKNDAIANTNNVETAIKTNDQYRGRLL